MSLNIDSQVAQTYKVIL